MSEQRLESVHLIPLEALHPAPDNPRREMRELEDLAASIKEHAPGGRPAAGARGGSGCVSRCEETGKRGFRTRAEARAELRRLQSTPKAIREAKWPEGLGKVLRRVYRCRFCQHWHLTSQGAEPRRAAS